MKSKKCSKCGKRRLLKFYNKKSSSKDGLGYTCKDCNKEYQSKYRGLHGAKSREYARLRRIRLPDEYFKYSIRDLYGMEPEDYQELLSDQKGLCAICGNKESARSRRDGKVKRLAVDHNHKTGNNRGLLCGKCNMALGSFGDNVDLLKSAIKYLTKYDK